MNVPNCALDERGVREQAARQQRLAPSVVSVSQGERRLVIDFAAGFDREALDEMLEVERRCCPFFQLEFDEQARRLTVAVDDPDHIPALDVLAAGVGARTPAR